MQQPTDDERGAQQVQEPERGAAEFGQQQQDQERRRVLGEVAVHAYRLLERRALAHAERNLAPAPQAHDVERERDQQHAAERGIEHRHDGSVSITGSLQCTNGVPGGTPPR